MSVTSLFVVTVGRASSRMATFRSGGRTISVPIWVGKLYEAKPRKRDGRYTWRLKDHITRTASGNQPSDKLIVEAEVYAAAHNYPFAHGIAQGQELMLSDLEILALVKNEEEG